MIDSRKKAYRGDGALERDSINVLDCIWCDLWFPTFERLAIHVANVHDPLMTKRPPHERTRTTMAKRKATTDKPARAARGARIPPPSGDAETNFAPFLKAANIGKVGTLGKINMKGEPRVVDGQFGEQIVIPVVFDGEQYDWAIGIDSVNHRILHDKFGANSKNWRGVVKVAIKESRQGRDYIAVVTR